MDYWHKFIKGWFNLFLTIIIPVLHGLFSPVSVEESKADAIITISITWVLSQLPKRKLWVEFVGSLSHSLSLSLSLRFSVNRIWFWISCEAINVKFNQTYFIILLLIKLNKLECFIAIISTSEKTVSLHLKNSITSPE